VEIEQNTEVVIIGGGIVGCTAAYFLTKNNVPVVLCEKGVIAGEQSSRNWGFVRQQGRDPAEVPLMMECNRMWQKFERELGARLDWIQGGNLYLADSEEKMAAFEAWIEIAEANDLDTQLLSMTEVKQLIPEISGNWYGGVHTPSDGQAEPTKVAPAFARAAQSKGANVYEQCVVFAIDTNNGAVSGVETERGYIKCNAVVCATGAWTGRMARSVGEKLPMMWMRGSVANTECVKPVSRAGIWANVGLRQRKDGSFNIADGERSDHDVSLQTLLSGRWFYKSYAKYKNELDLHFGKPILDDLTRMLAGNSSLRKDLMHRRTLDPAPNHKRLSGALAQLKKLFPIVGNPDIRRSWAGYIDFTPDMIPVIAPAQKTSGLIFAAGMSGHGFGLGPIVGRLASELATQGQSSMDISEFSMNRFVDGTVLEPRNLV